MSSVGLSKNERLALYGLVRHPSLNDRELAGELDLKMSTLTAIRNRLKRQGFYRTVRIPYLERLGGELLIVTHMRLNILRQPEEVQRALREVLGAIDDVFFAFSDLHQLMTFSLCRNYTDAWMDAEHVQQQLSERNALAARPVRRQTMIFPLNQTKVLRFFDFSRILGLLYGIEEEEPPQPVSLRLERFEPRELSRIEKRVYMGLVRFPDLADNDIAKKIGVTRQSVTKIRKRLEAERLIATARVPNLLKTGLEILAMAHYEAATSVTLSTRKKGIEWVVKEMPSFFHVAGQREGVIMGLASGYHEFQQRLFDVSRVYIEKGYFKDEPALYMLSLQDLVIVKDFSFAPMVKKVLQLRDEK
ncbi:MAG: MarR family transcriptional regulator [Euryarchaeota archaeon]|nr:MarR family transcriptional regulator [Euryarchaeota archaeon]